MKTELNINQKVIQAVKDVQDGMLENIEASKAEFDAKTRKKKAYYTLLKAKERLHAVEQELMEL